MCAATWAAPLPAIQIATRAEVTYMAMGSNLVMRQVSNEVVVTISPVEALDLHLEPPNGVQAGRTTTLHLSLINTGNTKSTYQFAFNAIAGDYAPTSPHLYLDVDTDGMIGPQDPEIGLQIGGSIIHGKTVELGSHESATLLLRMHIPTTAVGIGRIEFTATTQSGAASATVRAELNTSAEDAQVEVTKQASVSTASPGGELSYTIVAANTGRGDAIPLTKAKGHDIRVDDIVSEVVLVRDVLPAQATYVPLSLSGTGPGNVLVLYRASTDEPFSYRTVPGVHVDEVALGVKERIRPGEQAKLTFRIKLDGVLTGPVDNIGQAYFRGQSGPVIASSPLISLPVAQLSTISGHVWLDSEHTGRFADSAAGLSGWTAELLQLAGDAPQSFIPIARSRTDNSGHYQLSGLVAGRQYALRFFSPLGRQHGVPQDGEQGQEISGGERDFQHGMLRLTHIEPGRHYKQQSLGVTPSGVVYDAYTREPIQGATVTLQSKAPGFDPARHLVGGAANVDDLTGPDGFYSFILTPDAPAGSYMISTQAPGYRPGPSVLILPESGAVRAPVGHGVYKVAPDLLIPSTGDPAPYYVRSNRSLGAQRLVNNHLPLDPEIAPRYMLGLTKTADRVATERVGFVNYTLTLEHQLQMTLPGFEVIDTLPDGFAYVPGSARLANSTSTAQPMADPIRSANTLRFDASQMPVPAGTKATITYRVRVGTDAAENVVAINRARAFAAGMQSNEAAARVHVLGGVFSDDAFVAGKVFLDCNTNGVQDPGERGFPGARIYVEDGTFAETDGEGKYSLYGLKPLTHVLKLDAASLPLTTHALPLDNRNAGVGNSRFVDLHNGELGRADFALECTPPTMAEVTRRSAVKPIEEIDAVVRQRFDATPTLAAVGEIRSRPSSGTIDMATRTSSSESTGAERAEAPKALKTAPPVPKPAKSMPLVDLIKTMTPALAFIDLKEGDILKSRQTAVRVKGHVGRRLQLWINGREVAQSTVGTRAESAMRGVAVWEYVGVSLESGTNVLVLGEVNAEGKTQDQTQITVRVPGDLARLELKGKVPSGADGHTVVPIVVRALDAQGIPVEGRQTVTLSASAGRWQAVDLDPVEPGTQVLLDNGQGTFDLLAPSEPGEVVLGARAAAMRAKLGLTFAPQLRPMIAAGIVEGVITLRNRWIRAPEATNNGFEQQLSALSRRWGDSKNAAMARTAFFLKGQVKGEYLLTAAYDSQKDIRDKLFRDIEPDRYYPVYGDSSTRGFDAQSTSRLYLRVDRGQSYLLYGDFSTAGNQELRQLTQYNRALTGAKTHIELGMLQATAFASRDSLVQRIVEVQANGTSGPWIVFGPDYIEQSETIEIITRDREQNGLIINRSSLTRLVDYEVETLSGQLRLKRPVPSVDPITGGPNSIRITFESDGGGPKFWVYGAEAAISIVPGVQVGAIAIEDRNPSDAQALLGLTASVELSDQTTAAAEFAHTHSDSSGIGQGVRVAVRHETERLKAQLDVVHTNRGFFNQSAPVRGGRHEERAKAEYRLADRTRLKGEWLRTRDRGTTLDTIAQDETSLDGGLLAVEHAFANGMRAEVGMRRAVGASRIQSGHVGIDVLTARSRLTVPVPMVSDASAFVEYEQDVRNADKHILALGADQGLGHSTRLYGRHELLSSLGSLYELSSGKRTYRTLAGIESEYMADGTVFSEYRMDDAINGRDAQAALGLRNGWTFSNGLRLGSTFERTKSLGAGVNESTALTGTLEYFGDSRWKGSTSLELRRSSTERSLLNTWAVAVKFNVDWTLLARNTIYLRSGTNGGGFGLKARQRIGAAYRPVQSNALNWLAYYEQRFESGRQTMGLSDHHHAHIAAAVANTQISKRTTASARVAAKQVTERGYGFTSRTAALLLAARIAHDVTERWDVGLALAQKFGGAAGVQQALGAEIGYQMQKNLWLSFGYNVLGFDDSEFSNMVQSSRGIYFRIRYKFDEDSWS